MPSAREYSRDHRHRIGAAAATLVAHVAILLALLYGLAADWPAPVHERLARFRIIPPLDTLEELDEEMEPPTRDAEGPASGASPRDEGAPGPPALEAEPAEIVAPDPVLPLPPPPPVPTAPLPGTGSAPSSGAAPVDGPGPGAGGVGDGRGAGGEGAGRGGGGGRGGRETPPRRISGTLRNADYPAGLGERGIGGRVTVRFTVSLDGRATNCRVVRSSGNGRLDSTTCRLIEQRYRFVPSRDASGQPVLADVIEDHEWIVEDVVEEASPVSR